MRVNAPKLQKILKIDLRDLLFTPEELEAIEKRVTSEGIRCLVTGKNRQATPEEVIRQLYVYRLISRYGYGGRLDVERTVAIGTRKPRADIVVNKDDGNSAYIIVEVKNPKINTGIDQLESYVSATRAPGGVWTDGKKIKCFRVDERSAFIEIYEDIPHADEDIPNSIVKYDLTREKEKINVLEEELERERRQYSQIAKRQAEKEEALIRQKEQQIETAQQQEEKEKQLNKKDETITKAKDDFKAVFGLVEPLEPSEELVQEEKKLSSFKKIAILISVLIIGIGIGAFIINMQLDTFNFDTRYSDTFAYDTQMRTHDTSLSDMTYINFVVGHSNNTIWTIRGQVICFDSKIYDDGIVFFVHSVATRNRIGRNIEVHSSVEYTLERNYARLTGNIVLPSVIDLNAPVIRRTPNEDSPRVTVRFYGDGLELARFAEVTTSMPFSFDINVEGVNNLKITVYANTDRTYVALTNLGLHIDGSVMPSQRTLRLDNMQYSDFIFGNDNNNLWRASGNIVDFRGNSYSNGMLFFVRSTGIGSRTSGDIRAHSIIEYSLNAKYTSLRGTIVIPQNISIEIPEMLVSNVNQNSPTFTIIFYGDGVEIARFDDIETFAPVDFNISVRNIRVLSIAILGSRNSTYVLLTDLYLQ